MEVIISRLIWTEQSVKWREKIRRSFEAWKQKTSFLVILRLRIVYGDWEFLAQKQPSKGALWKRRSENMQQSHRKTSMPKFDKKVFLNYAADLQENTHAKVILIKLLSNFIDITLWHGCSPVNLLHVFRTPFYENTCKKLLLIVKLSLYQKY